METLWGAWTGEQMTEYYLDIETSDRNPWEDEVIAIAVQPVKWNRPDGELIMLKAWEGRGEKGVLREILRSGLFEVGGAKAFNFIPVGNNLMFDLIFLIVRTHALGIRRWTKDEVLRFFHEKPVKDVKPVLVSMNDGSFTGSGLGMFSSKKKHTGAVVPEMWRKRNFTGIERYIREDAAAFFEVYDRITHELRKLGAVMRVK